MTSPKCFTNRDKNKIRSSKQTAKDHAAFKIRSLSNKLVIISDDSQGEAKVLVYLCEERALHHIFSTGRAPERALDYVLSTVVASKWGRECEES